MLIGLFGRFAARTHAIKARGSGVALTAQCPYRIEIHTKGRALCGSSDAELAEAAWWPPRSAPIAFSAAVLIVAILTVHLPFGFTSIKLMAVTPAGPRFGPPGVETDLLYLACLASLVLTGPGPLALARISLPGKPSAK